MSSRIGTLIERSDERRSLVLPYSAGINSLFGRFNPLFARLGNWARKRLISWGIVDDPQLISGRRSTFCR
jgi:hypothetical protein